MVMLHPTATRRSQETASSEGTYRVYSELCLVSRILSYMMSVQGTYLQFCCSARIANIIILFLGIARATVQQSYIVLSMLNQIFYSLTAMLGFYIFWKMVQKLLERVAEKKPNKVFVPVTIVHWVLLAILSALSMAECSTYIAFIVKGINEGSGNLQLVFHYNKLSSGLSILCWVASFEILCWIIFAFVKSGDKKVISLPYSNYMRILMLIWSIQAEFTPLVIGGLFFFIINFILAIFQIQYVLQQNLAPDYLNVVESIIEFICTIGTYTGLILCFQRWKSNVSISAPQKLTDYEETKEESCASSIRSYHSMVYAHQQQQLHYAVPQGAPPSQQVHMFRPW